VTRLSKDAVKPAALRSRWQGLAMHHVGLVSSLP
jgi:hypothetical protein